jgi:tetratricopeptide (TPR) repeat protein
LGWKGIVATKLVEWHLESPSGAQRNESLRGAFERFLEVGRDADAASVAKELARTRGADGELATRLEEIAVKLKDLDALGIAHDLLVAERSGPARAEEMVRQAEVMVQAGVDSQEAIQHGEQALTSVPPEEVEPLLERLSKLAPAPATVIDLYERQITRCKNPADKLRALARAAQVAAENDALDRSRNFFDLALSGGAQDETLGVLEDVARTSDQARGSDKLRWTLAQAMSAGGQGSRDGGRTRGVLLRRAATLAHEDLKDTDKAFGWLGDAIVTHVDDEGLDALENLAEEVGDAQRAEVVLSRALEEVFDGPLVRKLLARRAALRRDRLGEKRGAATDLKKLHDLSPSDTAVMDQLSELYTDLEDYRGMVQLYEDQILRGKDPNARAELARKVARLWEEKLDDPREAADAWRRVLRMKAGDPEATEGLERAKQGMLTRPAARSEPEIAPPPKKAEAPPPKPAPKAAEPAKAPEPAPTPGDGVPPAEPTKAARALELLAQRDAADDDVTQADMRSEEERAGRPFGAEDDATVSASFEELQARSAASSPGMPGGGAVPTPPPPPPSSRPVARSSGPPLPPPPSRRPPPPPPGGRFGATPLPPPNQGRAPVALEADEEEVMVDDEELMEDDKA